jgi:hypothetical protein
MGVGNLRAWEILLEVNTAVFDLCAVTILLWSMGGGSSDMLVLLARRMDLPSD